MIIYIHTNVIVKILRQIDEYNYVIEYGNNSITSANVKDLIFLN